MNKHFSCSFAAWLANKMRYAKGLSMPQKAVPAKKKSQKQQ